MALRTVNLLIDKIVLNGHGFELPGFRAGRKPCWIFSFLSLQVLNNF